MTRGFSLKARSLKALVAALSVVVVSAGGCGGDGCGYVPPEDCADVFGQFEGIDDGKKLSEESDVDLATPGIQVDLSVLAYDQCDQDVPITSASLEHSDKSATMWAPGPEAALDGNRATFRGLTLAPGLRTVRVTFFTERGDNAETVTISLNVYDANARPEVVSVKFKGDANDDDALNAAELASAGGVPVAIVEVANLEEGRPVDIEHVVTGEVYGTTPLVGTTVEIALDALLDVTSEHHDLVVHVSNSKGLENKIKECSAGDCNDAAFVKLHLDATAPGLVVISPTEDDTLFGPSADAEPKTEGFQLVISATASSTAIPSDLREDIQIDLTGLPTQNVKHTNGAILTTLTLPDSGAQDYVLTVTARDIALNTAQSVRTFRVDYDPPVITFDAPVAAQNPFAEFTQTVTASVAGAEDGQIVHLFSRAQGSMVEVPLNPDLVVMGEKVTGTVTFPAGVQDLIGRVEDVAGNPAEGISPGLNIQGKGCSILVETPDLLMSSNDQSPTIPGLQMVIAGNSSNCPNTAVQVFVGASMTPIPATTDAAGDFQVAVTLQEGPVSVTVQMTDTLGAKTAATLQIDVDLTAPSFTFPANNAMFNAGVDLQELLAGAQQSFGYSPPALPDARVDVCTTGPTGAMMPPPCPDGASGWFLLRSDVNPSQPGFTYPDGVHQLKLVEIVDVTQTGFNVSAPLTLTVDVIRPSVTNFTLTGDVNFDGCLNENELAVGAPVIANVTANEPVTLVVQDAVSAAPYGSSAMLSAMTSAPLTLGMSMEADYDLVAVVTDALGNKNVIANATMTNPINMSAFKEARIDRVKPTTTLQAPTKLQLGLADDADPATGYQLRISTVSSLDVGALGVTYVVSGAPAPAAQTPNASGQATADVTLPATGTTSHNLSVTSTDECGNIGAAATRTVTVDRDPPALTYVAPKAAGGPYTTYTLTTTATVSGATNAVRVFTKVGSNPELELQSLPPPTYSAPVTYPNGTQTVRFEVTDAAGNVATASEAGVVVNGVGCSIQINAPTGSPALLNSSNDVNPATATTYEGAVTGVSSNCANKNVSLFRGTGPSRVLLAGPTATDATGNFTLNYALAEGTWVLEIEMDDGAGVINRVNRDVVVDLTAPTVTNVTPSGANLFFVSSSNIHLFPTTQAGYVVDGAPGGDAEVNVGLTATGASGGSASVTYGGVPVGGPVAISGSPAVVSIPVVLTQNSTGSLVISVTDAGGNVVSQTSAAVVDVSPPDAPVVMQAVVTGQERAAKVSLTWSPTFDDASPSMSPNQGYDVRWTTNAVREAGITSDADYFTGTFVKAEATIPWSASTILRVLDVPPLATYSISVRAFDEVGNYSAFATPTGLNNFWTTASLSNPSMTASQFFGFTIYSRGSLDPGTTDDLVVAAQGDNPGAVYVYFGGPSFSTTPPQKLSPPTSPGPPNTDSASQAFGADVSVGKVSDAANDLLIGSPSWSRPTGVPAYPAATGRAFLYFGGSNPIDTTSFIEFRGNAGSQLGQSAQIISDINGDGFGEVVLSAHTELSNQGRVYIFYGRPKGDAITLGSWINLQTANGGFVPMSTANVVIEGPTPVATSGGGNQFGRHRWGIQSLGNIDGAGPGEFSIPDSQDTVNKLFIFAGSNRTVTSPQLTLKTGGLPTPNDALQTLSQGTPGTGARYGFGTCAVGNKDFIGGPATDLLVVNAFTNVTYLFPDGTASGYGPPAATISGTSTFGSGCGVSDFNGDGKQDIALGQNIPTASSLYLFYNRGSAPLYDSQAGTGFSQSRLKGAKNQGVSLAIGDFNGDGKSDIATGDHLDVSGKVNVWY